ncbi:MAG: hypothetical protein JST35_00410 [Armatimonadetes bacterium]|jgi:outer membrane lipoprotein-sorting protein|nr:hypothetical protein [Armatimonadota bacterium]
MSLSLALILLAKPKVDATFRAFEDRLAKAQVMVLKMRKEQAKGTNGDGFEIEGYAFNVTLTLKQPNYMRYETSDGYLQISDGKTLYERNRDGKESRDTAKTMGDMTDARGFDRFINGSRTSYSIIMSDKKFFVGKTSGEAVTWTSSMTVDRKTGHPLSYTYQEKSDPEETTTYLDIKLNVKLPKDIFKIPN